MATTWAAGEYPLMAQRLRGAAQRAVDLARVAPGERVLDVACGTGNAALLAAARGAEVVGVDLEPALLDVARALAAEAGLEARWAQGDWEALPVDGGAFDVVISAFGVTYAADPARAAAELARVCAPGARVVLTTWAPGSFLPAMGAALAPLLGGPPLVTPPAWDALLEGAGLIAGAPVDDHLVLRFADRLSAVAFLVRTAGHVVQARPRLEAEGRWPQLLATLGALVTERAEPAAAPAGLALRLDYTIVTASAP